MLVDRHKGMNVKQGRYQAHKGTKISEHYIVEDGFNGEHTLLQYTVFRAMLFCVMS